MDALEAYREKLFSPAVQDELDRIAEEQDLDVMTLDAFLYGLFFAADYPALLSQIRLELERFGA